MELFSTTRPTFTVIRKTTKALRSHLLFSIILVSSVFSFLSSEAQLSGVKNIPGDYATLSLAIADLNTQGVGSGGVTLNLLAGNPETAPGGGYSITTTTATATDQITIAGNGNTITAPTPQTSGNLNDAIFKIIGADYVTIQGFTMLENAANTTTVAGTNNMTEWGVALLYASATNGAQNNTIENNTITLNRTYQNTFGIYSNSTHTAAAVTATASATGAAGGNSNLKLYTNNISNVNMGIVVVGPAAAADYNAGIDIGGTSAGQGNTISNYGTTGTFSGYASVSATVFGILVRNSTGLNISYNSVTSSAGGVTAGTLRGIYVPAFNAAPTGTFTNNINNNTIALTYGVATGTMQGITVEATTGNNTSTQNITNNNFTALTASIASSVVITAISDVMANLNTNINSNTLTNITTNTTGSFTFIGHSFTVPPTGTQNINGNSIVTALNKTGAGGTVSMMTSGASTISASAVNHTNNIFSNITVTGATGISGIINTDGLSTISYGRTVTGNTFNNWTGGTNAITVMSYTYWGGTTGTISNNTITNITGQAAITAISTASSGNAANPYSISSNTINNLSSTGTGGAVIGITCTNTSTGINIQNNTINTLASTGASAVTGISIGGATSTNVFKNKIYDLSGSNASSTVNGLLASSGTVNIFNNIIGDLRAPIASAANPINGINITGGTTMNVVFNTVRLDATSSGTNFGSSAVSVSSTPTTALGNNIFINNSTANGTGFTVAYRRSTTTLTSYAAASDNNILFAGTPSASNLIFFDGSNSDQTIDNFKSRVNPRDEFSFSENTTFTSLVGANSGFLHVDLSTPTFAEAGAVPVAGIPDDFDSQTRNVSTPDIGADEFNGVAVQIVELNSVSINPTGNKCVAEARTVTANITVGGSSLTSVVLRYSVEGGAPVSVNMTGGTNTPGVTSDWTGTIPASGSALIAWSVEATDPLVSPELAGTGYRDDPLSGGYATTVGTPNPVCAGGPISLMAKVAAAGGTATMGPGATTSTTFSGPFYSLWNNKHQQILVTASELTLAGLFPGNITGITFYTTTIDGTDLNLDYSIKMANTAATDLNAFISTGLVPVYSTPTFSPVVGANPITFSSPFTWDGTSNVVVEICFGNPSNTNTLGGGAQMDVTSYVSNRVEYNTSSTGGPISGTALCGSVGNNNAVYSTRPRMSFTGVAVQELAGYVWNDGSSNFGTGNPINAYPVTPTTYTYTATDVNGCTIASTPYNVTLITGPNAPNPNNSTQCGTGVPGAFVTTGGGGAGFKWYDAQIAGNLLQSGGAQYTSAISVTTVFWVSESNGTCESLRAAVTATVTEADSIEATANDLTPCANSALQLSVSNIATAPSNTYTYTWSASPITGSGMPSALTGSSLSITPTLPGTYVYTVNADDGDCSKVDEVTVVVQSLPLISSVTADPPAVCAGVSSTLTALSGTFVPGFANLGTQTTTLAAANGNPYRSGFVAGTQGRLQLLIRASDLQAQGLSAGTLNSLAFTTTSAAGTFSSYNIDLATTSLTVLTTTFETAGFVNVYSSPFTPAPNSLNTHNFHTAFPWNGTSNIVVNICFTISSASLATTVAAYAAGYAITNQSTVTAACTALTGTTATNAAIMRWGGQIGGTGPGTYNWVWNPGALPGNSVSVSPLTTTIYTVTATDPATTCSLDSTISLTIYDLPAAVSANNSEHCGTAVPTASVSSNSGAPSPVFNWYDAPTGGTLLQTGISTTYLDLVGVTTNFYVSEISAQGCAGPRALITVTVIEADPINAGASSTSLCPGTPVTLTATQTGSTNTYVYTWTATPASGSGIPTEEAGNPVTITPTGSGSYIYQVSAFDADKGCTAVDEITVTVNPTPIISSVTASPTSICLGTSSTLTAFSGMSNPGTASVGTATGTTQNGSPFRAGNATPARTQLIYTAAELSAAGFTAGNFTAIGFNFTAVSGGTLPSFTIKIGHTASSVLTTTLLPTPATVVYGPVSLNPPTVTGIFTIPFTTAFNWDGSSNLLIDICHELPSPSAVSGSVASVTMATNMTSYNLATGACTATSGTVQTARVVPLLSGVLTVNNTSSYNWVWNPGNISAGTTGVATVSPSVTTSYTVIATNPVSGCKDTSAEVTVTVNPLPAAPGTNSPVTRCGAGDVTLTATAAGGTLNWYNVPTGGTSLHTGASFTTGITGSTSFWVAETSLDGCEGPRAEVQVISTTPPTLTITPGGPTAFCSGGSVVLDAAVNSSSTYVNFEWSPVGGLSAATGAIVTASPTDTTTYTLLADDGVPNGGGCANIATITITVNPNPVISSVTATPSTICSGASTQLEAKSNIGSPLSVKVGTGTTGNAGASNPYWRSAEGAKVHLLYLASEMTNAGFTAGPIHALRFNVLTVGTNIYFDNYKIAMANTSLTAVNTPLTTAGFVDVYQVPQYVVTAGDNTHTFNIAPFIWDGTSNVILQFCYDNDPNNTCASGCNGTTPSVEYTAAVGFNGGAYVYGANTTDPNRDFCNSPTGTSGQQQLRSNVTFIRGFSNNTSLYNWTWNPGALTGAIVSASPGITTEYTVTATIAATTCTTSAPITVTVNAVPSAPVTNDPVTRCGPGSVTLTATNTGGTMNWYNVATGGTSLHTGDTYTTTVPGATSFWAGETYFAGCEGPRTEVHVTVTTSAPLVITAAGSTTFCAGNSLSLDAATNSDPSYVNFNWTPSATLSSPTGAVVTATPVNTITYTVTADDGLPGGCANTANITLTVNPNPLISSATATPPTTCNGSAVTLTALTGSLVPGFANLGTQTTTLAAANGNPYRSGFAAGTQGRLQILIRASDLQAQGLSAGTLNSLAFTTTSSAGTFSSYNIDLAPTSLTALTTTFETAGFVNVYSAPFTPAPNSLNTHNFQTAFPWNGTSNIVVNICFTISSASLSTTVAAYAAGYAITSQNTSATSCTALTGTTATNAPIMRWGGQTGGFGPGSYNWVWNPGNIAGNSVSVSPSVTTTYTVTATDAISGCISTEDVTVSVENVGANATASPSTPVCAGTAVILNANPTGGAPFGFSWSNGTSVVGTTNPLTVNPTVTTTYTVTVTDACGNPVTTGVTVTVNPLPTVTVSPTSASFCYPGGTPVTLTASGSATSYTWSPALGLSAATGISVDASPSITTTYTVTGTDGNGCVKTANAVITVNPNVTSPVASASPATVCAGSPITLTSSATLNGPVNGYTMNSNSGVAFIDISGGLSVGTLTDDSEHNISIPSFDFNGTTYTTGRVGANGLVVFGSNSGEISTGNATLPSTANTAGNIFLAPYWDDLDIQMGATIHTQTVGNKFIIQFSNFAHNAFTTGAITFQVQLDLATKAIHFVYPDVIFGSATYNAGVNATVGIQRTSSSAVLYSFNSASLVDGQSITFTPTYTQLPISYSWSGPDGYSSIQQNPTATATSTGTYTVTFTSAVGCSASATTNTVTVVQPFVSPTPAPITGITNVCPYIGLGNPDGLLTYSVPAIDGATYNWVIPPTNVTLVSGQGTNSINILVNNGFASQPNKQIRVTQTVPCGTPSAIRIFYMLTQFPNTPDPITGPTDVCPFIGTGFATYSVPPVTAATSYIWTGQSGTTTITYPNGQGVNGNTVNVAFSSGFTASMLTVQSVNDCGVSGLRSISLTRNAPSTPSLISGPTNACAHMAPNGTPATYTVPQVAGMTYTWTLPAGAIGATPQGSNTISFTYPATFTTGTVSVTATSGCGTSSARSLSISKLNPSTPGVVDIIQTGFCEDAGGRQYSYTIANMPANATTVQWTIPAGATFVSGQGTTSIVVDYPPTAINDSVTAQAVNNCAVSSKRKVVIKLPACPPPGLAGKGNVAVTTPTPAVASMEVKIFPNPTVSDFRLEVLTASKEQITVRVLDAQGRLFKSFKLMAFQTISLGAELKAGSYLVEVRQGRDVKTTKVIKF